MFAAPRGTRDILTPMAEEFVHLETLARDVARLWGFQEIRFPTFEETALFTASVGAATDIVEHEMYSFDDRGGRKLALRPEGTASVVRAYLEHSLYKQEKKTQFFYIANMFRAERPQAGRYREFEQVGFEVFGDPTPFADVDLILAAMEILKRFGISQMAVAINSIGCPKCRDPYREKLFKRLESLSGQLCKNCQKRRTKNPLRVLDCKNCYPKLTDQIPILEKCPECAQHDMAVQELLKSQCVRFVCQPHLVRGLEYYTRTVFEIISNQAGSQGALCGGGRYDGLTQLLGGPPIPAAGFAIGVDRAIEAKNKERTGEGEKKRPSDSIGLLLILASSDPASQTHALKACQILRLQSLRVVFGVLSDSVKGQMRQAERWKASHCVIVGDQERQQNSYTLKNLSDGTQKQLRLEELLSELRKTNQ